MTQKYFSLHFLTQKKEKHLKVELGNKEVMFSQIQALERENEHLRKMVQPIFLFF